MLWPRAGERGPDLSEMIRVRAPQLCTALAALALLAASVAGQMPPGQFGGGRPSFTAVKSDIPYIECGVCEALAKNAYRQVKTARDALRPGKKVRSGDLLFPNGTRPPTVGGVDVFSARRAGAWSKTDPIPRIAIKHWQ